MFISSIPAQQVGLSSRTLHNELGTLDLRSTDSSRALPNSPVTELRTYYLGARCPICCLTSPSRAWHRPRRATRNDSGRRGCQTNSPKHLSVEREVPHLRIIDGDLWQAVKRRQREIVRPRTDPHTTNPLNDRHRPRFLLSGLLTCATCGGGFTIRAKDRYGCATRGRQGTCTNSRTIPRQELERRVLDGLQRSLLTPELVAEFISEYQREWNRLQSERGRETARRHRRLADVKRRIAGLVDGIERGIITATTKERLEILEAEKTELEQMPAEQSLPSIHPNLAEMYRGKVVRLEQELADPEVAADAKSLLRSMISAIVVTPGAKRGEVELELQGELAGVLALAQGKQNEDGTMLSRVQLSVVAGVGFEPTTFRL